MSGSRISKAAAGLAQANRELVTDELAATAGENGRTAGEACSLLLAAVGGEPSDEAAFWKHGSADGHPAAADWIGGAAVSKWVESRCLKERRLIKRFRIREPWSS
jgi:hypothetical protein